MSGPISIDADGQVRTTGVQPIEFRGDGRFRIATAIDITEAISNFVISTIIFRREIAGLTGTTEIDIKKNGVTIFTTPANRPKITAASGDAQRVTAIPDITTISTGDRLEMDIIDVETGNPQDCVAIILPV